MLLLCPYINTTFFPPRAYTHTLSLSLTHSLSLNVCVYVCMYVSHVLFSSISFFQHSPQSHHTTPTVRFPLRTTVQLPSASVSSSVRFPFALHAMTVSSWTALYSIVFLKSSVKKQSFSIYLSITLLFSLSLSLSLFLSPCPRFHSFPLITMGGRYIPFPVDVNATCTKSLSGLVPGRHHASSDDNVDHRGGG